MELAARFRPGILTSPAGSAKAAMATVARRHQGLSAEIARLDDMLAELVICVAPQEFLARQGIATQSASTLLATAGDNHRPASRATAGMLQASLRARS